MLGTPVLPPDLDPDRTTRVNRPRSNDIVERLHGTLLDEHFRIEGSRTRFETIEEMQAFSTSIWTAKVGAVRTRVAA